MQVKLNDLSRQYKTIKNEIDQAIFSTIDKSSFIGGELVTKFEKSFASYNKVKHCIGCANGTDAIEIALEALGILPEEEILVPAITWISTAGAVRNIGAKPVFVDVDEDQLIDLTDAKSKLTKKTRGIIPVHLFGQVVNMNKLMNFATQNNLAVIEDCAQAHGAEFNGQKVGTFGNIGTFSFYPGKNLGAYGDAGGIITNSTTLDEKCRLIRNHGQRQKHEHIIKGRNSRLDSIQASILNVKLKYLPDWTSRRIEVAKKYKNLLSELPIKLPSQLDGSKHVFHLYVISTSRRDELKLYLENNGVQTAIHYPTPLPYTQTFKEQVEKEYTGAKVASTTCLSIPIYPEITDEEIVYVGNHIKRFFDN